MRLLLITAATVTSFAGFAVGSSPAAAWDYAYPYCLRGPQPGYPGFCTFVSYGQCLATASGTDSYCDINPRVAVPYSTGRFDARANWLN